MNGILCLGYKKRYYPCQAATNFVHENFWKYVSRTAALSPRRADEHSAIRPTSTDFSPHRVQLLKELFCTKPNIAIPRCGSFACVVGVLHDCHRIYIAKFYTKQAR
jgi:hypothetical protein